MAARVVSRTEVEGGDGDRDGVEVEWFRSGGTTRDRNATPIGYL
jgi:hypothetical protein